jgi:hypothetical protein
MEKSDVLVRHIKLKPLVKGAWERKAAIWINGVEIVGVIEYDIHASVESRLGVMQQFTITMWADIVIEHVEGAAE